jgi:hypothetical protein
MASLGSGAAYCVGGSRISMVKKGEFVQPEHFFVCARIQNCEKIILSRCRLSTLPFDNLMMAEVCLVFQRYN